VRGSGFGVVLLNPKWKRFTMKNYLAQGKSIRQLQHNLEMMILLSYLTPTASGITFASNQTPTSKKGNN